MNTTSVITACLLAFVACLSPLFTMAHLWQLKEWRIDRLLEHLRSNGCCVQLFGKLRPPIVAVLFVLSGFHVFPAAMNIELIIGLFFLATLTVIQVTLKKQPKPVWTAKAKIIVLLSSILSIGATLLLLGSPLPELTMLLALLQPFVLGIAWVLLKPVDVFLKNRTLRLAEAIRAAHPNLTVIGITGSVGKTTTKELLAHLLKSKGALATPAHVNSEMGVAEWLRKTLKSEPPNSTKIVIVEMGAYRVGEIALLCRMTKPSIGIITYVGAQHLSLFGNRDAIIQAKGELFASLPADGHAFANRDNDACDALLKRCRCKATTVGTGQQSDVLAVDIEETQKGISFKVDQQHYRVPLAGTHTVTSILLALATAKSLGMTPKEMALRLQSFSAFDHTFTVKTVKAVTILDDTYNSSPASVTAAIQWAAAQPHATKTLVIDGIIELGSEEESIHRSIASHAANVFDSVYVVQPRFLPYFADAFGDKAFLASGVRTTVPEESLLVCVGRMPEHLIHRFIS